MVNYYIMSMTYGGVNMSEREYEALRSALTSTRMEGFDVTEQTEKDCIRLIYAIIKENPASPGA